MTQSAPCASGADCSASSWRRAELARAGWEARQDGLRLGVHERGTGAR